MRDFTWTFALSSPLDIVAANRAEIPAYAAANAARNRPAQDWNGWATHEHALALAESGWTDAPNLSDLAEKIAPTETRQSHEMRHAVTGACVDVSRYLEGHPENMLEFTEEPAPKRISISIDLCKAAQETPRQLELAGAVALAVIDTLARSAFAVDLSAHAALESKQPTGRHALTTFPLARAGEPIDPDRLAFWLCHPAALRSLIFGFWDTCPADFYHQTRQQDARGSVRRPSAESLGVDYVLTCSPETEEQARIYYRMIIEELQNAA